MGDVLGCPMGANDADADTVGGYLTALASGVWAEGEEFDGKRPFGHSDWAWDLYTALARNGVAAGWDVDAGQLASDFDPREADRVVTEALRAAVLCESGGAPTSGR